MIQYWSIPETDHSMAASLAAQCGISRLLAQCLLNREGNCLDRIQSFLTPRLSHLLDPFELPQMAQAVERLYRAREQSEHVVLFGDYDVDGVTSTALVFEVLTALGWKVEYFLPHRLDDGYGLKKEAVEKCLEKHPATLLIALDCGSNSSVTIEWLREKGVDVVVLDHHQIDAPPPKTAALINPQAWKKPGMEPGGFASEEYCTVGLAFKLAHALVKQGRKLQIESALGFDIKQLLDLVALGTIADLVSLKGENRILVSAGLSRIASTTRPGLCALKTASQVTETIDVHTVAYSLAPRLNAAGRLEDAELALKLLLLNRQDAVSTTMAAALDARNRERQNIERQVSNEVIDTVKARFQPNTDYVIVEGQPSWHVGVVGIVASRVLRQFYRPTIIVGGDGDFWRGSGRSIAGFDLAEALRGCDDLLLRHGGHAMAAGLTVAPDQLGLLRNRLNDLAHQRLNPSQLLPRLRLDGWVMMGELSEKSIDELDRLEPTGQGNPPVQFASRDVFLVRPPMRIGKEQQHLKMWVSDGSAQHEAVWWGGGAFPAPEGRFNLAYAPKVNLYNGRRSVQLRVLDWKPVSEKIDA